MDDSVVAINLLDSLVNLFSFLQTICLFSVQSEGDTVSVAQS